MVVGDGWISYADEGVFEEWLDEDEVGSTIREGSRAMGSRRGRNVV